MFNDLNNTNAANRPAVDDIFAETDKPGVGGIQSDIETHRVGLAVAGENLPGMEMFETTGSSKSYLKIIIIIVIILVILGGGYFAYSQFIKTRESAIEPTAPSTKPAIMATTTATPKPAGGGFVTVVPGIASTTVVNPVEIITSSTPTSTESVVTPSIIEATIDSDSDGLTDSEEKIAGTNLNVIDTDNDGLSDYEEVKIYHTNPLKADTDGDSYPDGVEVKSGYNPNGPGKLTDNQPKK